MRKLTNQTLIVLFFLVVSVIITSIVNPPPLVVFINIVVVAFVAFFSSTYLKNKETSIQLAPISIGFVGGFGLNKLLSANYLANFTGLSETEFIEGYIDGFAFVQDVLFLSLIVTLILSFIVLRYKIKSLTISQKLIYVFFGVSVVSLALAGLNFTNNLLQYLPSVAFSSQSQSIRTNFQSWVIMDIIKSLFLAGLFNVLEKIVRMTTEVD